MLSRFLLNKNFPLFQQTFYRVLSSFSKNYVCDSSVIEAYQTNEKLKSIIDRQEHHFYYYTDKKEQLQQIPTVFKQIPVNSHLPENAHYLNNSTSENATDDSTKKTSIDELIQVTFWNDFSKGRFPALIGMEILSVSHGYLSCQLKVQEELLAPTGYLHAGVVVTLADTACGYGCQNSKPSHAKLFTTIELKSNFLGTIKPPGVITCEARLIHGGKTTQVWDAQVKDSEKKKLIAVFRCTQLIIY